MSFSSGVYFRSSTVNQCARAASENLLGPVDKPDPQPDASEQDKTKEAGVGLVVSGCNTALFLEVADEALDSRAQCIELLADRKLNPAIAFGRDFRRGT